MPDIRILQAGEPDDLMLAESMLPVMVMAIRKLRAARMAEQMQQSPPPPTPTIHMVRNVTEVSPS